jgi:hypothetical protein
VVLPVLSGKSRYNALLVIGLASEPAKEEEQGVEDLSVTFDGMLYSDGVCSMCE